MLHVERLEGNVSEAEACGQEAVRIARDVQQPWTIAETQRDLGDLYRAIGRNDAAVQAYEAAANAFTRLGSVRRAQEMSVRSEEIRKTQA